MKRVEWVLFTHHHREQCQGAPRLKACHTSESVFIPAPRLAAPEAARGVRLVALDLTLDGRRYGEWFDLVTEVRAEP